MIPLVILLPGYLDSKDYSHFIELDKQLSQQNYQVIRLDPPGIWTGQGLIRDYTMTNILKLLQQTIQENRQMNQPLYLIGHSLGGLIALLYAAHHSNITGVVAIQSPYAFVRPVNTYKRTVVWKEEKEHLTPRDLPQTPYQIKKFMVPYAFVEDSLQYDGFKALKTVICPKLFIAGENDEWITPIDVHALFEAAPEPKDFEVLPGIQHDYRKYPEQINMVNQTILKWLHDLYPSRSLP